MLIAGGAGYITYRADVRRAVPIPWLTATLRGLVILLALLLLLAPVFTITSHETRKPVVVFVQDHSASVAEALKADTTAYAKEAAQLIDKLKDRYDVVTWNLEGNTGQDSLFTYNGQVTDLSGTLTRVQELYGTQNLGGVILASDGRYNQGVNPSGMPVSLKGALYTIGIGDTNLQQDLRISNVYANKTVALNNSFEIKAAIVATGCAGYNNAATVYEQGTAIGAAPVNIAGDRYDRLLTFTIKADKPGVHHFVVQVPAANGEANTANNRKDVFVEAVDEQKHILIAGAAPHPDIKAIRTALAGLDNYRVTVRVNNDFPTMMDDYDILVLHQLPSQGFRNTPTISRADKPAWYIAGSRMDNNAMANLRKPVAASFSAYTARQVYPAVNPSFNAFTLPKNTREVVDKYPPLAVPSGKFQLLPGAQAIFTDRTAGDFPLWALLPGKVPTAMVSGDGLWRWRMYEYKQTGKTDVIDECIRQTISFLSTTNNDKPFRVTLPRYVWSDREPISLNAYLRNANNEPVNQPNAALTIRDSNGRETPYTFDRAGNAYQVNIGVRAGGTYHYTATTNYNGTTLAASGSFVVETTPLELMETGADYQLLYSLAKNNNGSFFARNAMGAVYDSIVNNERIKPVIETTLDTVPLIDRKWFFVLVLLVAVAEWLLRKYWLAQ